MCRKLKGTHSRGWNINVECECTTGVCSLTVIQSWWALIEELFIPSLSWCISAAAVESVWSATLTQIGDDDWWNHWNGVPIYIFRVRSRMIILLRVNSIFYYTVCLPPWLLLLLHLNSYVLLSRKVYIYIYIYMIHCACWQLILHSTWMSDL